MPESVKYNGAEVAAEETVNLSSFNTGLTVSGTMAADKLAVLFVDDEPVNIIVTDSFGNFSGTYNFAPRAAAYQVYMKGANYNAVYSSATTTSFNVQAQMPEDTVKPEIVLISPANGASINNDTAQIIFTVTDVLGTVDGVGLK